MLMRTRLVSTRNMIPRSVMGSAISFGLSVAVLTGLVPQNGFGRDHGWAIGGVVTPSRFAPIGSMESMEFTTVNGKPVHGTTPIWSGDLLCVAESGSARVFIESIAEMVLDKGATFRISTSLSMREGAPATPTLVASLANGQLRMHLHDGASAYIEAAGSAINAVGWADFQITIRGSEAVVERYGGVVEVKPQITRRLEIGRAHV